MINIFVLAEKPGENAEAHSDQHLMTMPRVYAELLQAGSVLHYESRKDTPLVKHVLGRWASSYTNWWWLYDLQTRCLWEQERRFKVIDMQALEMREQARPIGVAPNEIKVPKRFVQVLSPEFKTFGDSVSSYRKWYQQDQQGASWTKRGPPEWWHVAVQNVLF